VSDHRDGFLTGAGGVRIFWQAWSPDSGSRAVVVVAHGAGEHSDRYAHVAARLVAEGYAVYAIEHRGHGRSEGPRALIDRLGHAVADLDALITRATDEHPGPPLFLFGHSMGATVAVSYAIRRQDRLAGLMLSGPLAALEAAPPHMRAAARVLSVLTPGLPLVPIDANQISRDPAVVKAYVEDPLVHHGKLPVRTISELARAIDGFPREVTRITVPTLIMYGTADELCPIEGSAMLAANIGATDLTVKGYEGLYHEILNEPEQDRVLEDMCAWLGSHVAAVASR
jgi:acylglycerol lipase